MKKQISRAFGKTIYLLGRFKDGKRFWLEQASWDCDWYWGFGYIETYTNDRTPHMSRDTESHQHYDSLCFKEINNKFIYLLSENPEIESTVLRENEQWELSDLMMSFYTLSKTSRLYHIGNSHYTSKVKVDLKNEEAYKRINEVELPKIFASVYELLTP